MFADGYAGDKLKILEKFKEFEAKTCIKLEETEEDTHGRLKIISDPTDPGCWSYVGRKALTPGSTQELSLEAGKCETGMTPLHEVMHAIGFWHEQQREDRDRFVKIHPDLTTNINYMRMDLISGGRYPWEELNPNSEYDFSSIMHYPSWMQGGIPTIALRTDETKPAPTNYDNTFSAQDLRQINYAYPCGANECQDGTHQCDVKAKCVNDIQGYHCVCFPGFTGDGINRFNALKPGCTDINECDLGTHNCASGTTCYNTLGSFRCSQMVDVVWTVDGTGSYKGNRDQAIENFKILRKYLDELDNGLTFRMGLTFFSDRWFSADEMTSTIPDQYALGLPLTDVGSLSNDTIEAAFEPLQLMYWGDDMAEDVLSGIVFTRTDPAVGWNAESIKQLHVFTDNPFHYRADSSSNAQSRYDNPLPPLTMWTTPASPFYTYHEKTVVSGFTLGHQWNDATESWDAFSSGTAIDQIFFNVAGCYEECSDLYKTTFLEIPEDITDWSPGLTRSGSRKHNFSRGLLSSGSISESFDLLGEKIAEIVDETVAMLESKLLHY